MQLNVLLVFSNNLKSQQKSTSQYKNRIFFKKAVTQAIYMITGRRMTTTPIYIPTFLQLNCVT